VETPIQGQKRKRSTDEIRAPRKRLTHTPIQPLKGWELKARVQYLDDEISQLKKDISELTRERTLLAGSTPQSRIYTGRTSDSDKLQMFSAIIAKWNLPEFLYRTFRYKDENGSPVHRTTEHADSVSVTQPTWPAEQRVTRAINKQTRRITLIFISTRQDT
jgi:hypothetical protein